jgi:hypothetical protein
LASGLLRARRSSPLRGPITRLLLIRLTPQTPRDSVGRNAPGVSSVVARV